VLFPGNTDPQQGLPVPQDAATSHGTKNNYWVRELPTMLNGRKNSRGHFKYSWLSYKSRKFLKEKALHQIVLATGRKHSFNLLQKRYHELSDAGHSLYSPSECKAEAYFYFIHV